MMNKPIPNETSDSLRIPILSPDTVERVATAVIHHISVTYIIAEKCRIHHDISIHLTEKYQIFAFECYHFSPAMVYSLRQYLSLILKAPLRPVVLPGLDLCKHQTKLP